MPLLKRKRILACKTEVTVGTAETLAAADAAANYFDVQIDNDIPHEARMGQGSFANLRGVPGSPMGTCKFKTQLIGGAAAPLWMATLLPACGLVETALTWTPKSFAPGTGSVKTVTIGVYEDGLFKRLRGAMGNVKFTLPVGQICFAEFEFKGIWDAPSDVALLAPNYPDAEIPARFVASTFTVNGSALYKVSKLEFDVGNDVQMREDASDASGYASAIITNRQVKGSLDPESALVAALDFYGLQKAGTQFSISALVNDGAGGDFTIGCNKIQFSKIGEGDRNGIQTDAIEFVAARNTDAGDDELTITIGL